MVTIVRTVDGQAQSLANYLPGGKLFSIKNIQNSNFRKLLVGLAGELFTADGYIRSYSQEILPDEAVLFIDEWEKALGIPDDCFSGTGTLDDRRKHILVKLASLGIQTADDFVDLAALFGVTITVTPGSDFYSFAQFPVEFPFPFFGSEEESRFNIVVEFTIQDSAKFTFFFPYTFGDALLQILECLFNKLKPANCTITFKQV